MFNLFRPRTFIPSAYDFDAIFVGLEGAFPWLQVERECVCSRKTTLHVKVSLDRKDSWEDRKIENSRWGHFVVKGGKLSMLEGGGTPQFNEADVRNATEVVTLIRAWGVLQ